MEDLDAALNTYRVLILNEDPYGMINEFRSIPFLIDITDYPYVDYNSRIDGAESAMEILADYEHYEKCTDLREYIKELKDEVQRLSTENN